MRDRALQVSGRSGVILSVDHSFPSAVAFG